MTIDVEAGVVILLVSRFICRHILKGVYYGRMCVNMFIGHGMVISMA
jgi:hypothetical protein